MSNVKITVLDPIWINVETRINSTLSNGVLNANTFEVRVYNQ